MIESNKDVVKWLNPIKMLWNDKIEERHSFQNIFLRFYHFTTSLQDSIISQHLYWIRSFHNIFTGFTHFTTSLFYLIISQHLYWIQSFHNIIGFDHFTTSLLDSIISQHLYRIQSFHNIFMLFDHFTTSLLNSVMIQSNNDVLKWSSPIKMLWKDSFQ